MKKLTGISLFIFFCVVSAILTAGLVFYQNKNNTNTVGVNNNTEKPILYKDMILNLKEVSKHNTNTDCWMIINNKIYNVSDYASSHPGGARNILNYCGKEATQAFDTKGGSVDTHSSSANNLLNKYYIGSLVM